jgi:hypothetical protein
MAKHTSGLKGSGGKEDKAMVDEFDDDQQELAPIPMHASWLDALQDQFGNVPWWIASILMHLTFLLVLMMLGAASMEGAANAATFTSFVDKKELEEKKVEEIIKQEKVKDVETEIIVHEEANDENNETEDNMDLKMAHGDEDAISDIPLGGTGTVGYLGVGGGGAGLFGYRTGGGKRKALRGGGGGDDTENAVNRALEWLARHQEPEGKWDGEKYEGEDTDSALTGLAALAFLGAGHTERTGKYKNNVLRAVDWIIKDQGANGCIGASSTRGGLGYHHAICGMALSEAFGMAKVAATGAAEGL